jgi:hypothetical protein
MSLRKLLPATFLERIEIPILEVVPDLHKKDHDFLELATRIEKMMDTAKSLTDRKEMNKLLGVAGVLQMVAENYSSKIGRSKDKILDVDWKLPNYSQVVLTGDPSTNNCHFSLNMSREEHNKWFEILEECLKDIDNLEEAKAKIHELGLTVEVANGKKFEHQKSEKTAGVLDHMYMSNMVDIVDGKFEISIGSVESRLAELLVFVCDFHDFGKKIFTVDEELYRQLEFTDVDKIDDFFLELPYECTCFHIPNNETLTMRGQLIEWVYISQYNEDGKKEFKVLSVSRNDEYSINKFEFAGGDIIKQVNEYTKVHCPGPLAQKEARELFSMLTALLLYLKTDDVEKSTVHPAILPGIKYSRIPVCHLGQSITISKHSGHRTSAGTHTTTKNVVKWSVRGHFRTYRKGEWFKEDKVKRILPFLKGRERNNDSIPAKPSNYTIK